MKNGEKGQALPIVLFLLAFGGLVITPFLDHAGSGLIGSRLYGEAITGQYSCDAGVEHAIWNLAYDGLADRLSSPGDNISYKLGEAINGIFPDITVIREETAPVYEITSAAGDTTIRAVVEISGDNVAVSQWQITP